MKVKFHKRLIAYFIDIILIVLVVHLVSPIFPTFGDTKQISNDYNSLLERARDTDYLKSEEFTSEYTDLMYRSSKATYLTGVFNICVYLGYFVIMPVYTKGKTAGKKLMQLQLIDESGNDLNFNQLLLRGAILYGIPVYIINQILLLVASKNIYFNVSNVLSGIFTLVSIVCVFMILFRGDQKGLHDLAAKTVVISTEGNDTKNDEKTNDSDEKSNKAVTKSKRQVGGKVEHKVSRNTKKEVNNEKLDRTRNSKKRKSRED